MVERIQSCRPAATRTDGLYVPTAADLQATLTHGPEFWRRAGLVCDEDALPPVPVLQRALELMAADPAHAPWYAPRWFLDCTGLVMVGSGGCKNHLHDPAGVEIGYGVAARLQGRGHATRGVRALVQDFFAQPEVQVIFATVLPSNHASRRVLEKCGFRPHGRVHDPDDGWLDRHEIRRQV
jgi:RimJ/RimL family protein N-acetyltransferase